MPIDTGSRGRARRIGPTHTNTNAPVSRPNSSYQHTVSRSDTGPQSQTSKSARRVAEQQSGPIRLTEGEGYLTHGVQSPLVWAVLEGRRQAALARAHQSVINIIANAPSYLKDTNPKVNLGLPLSGQRDRFAAGVSVAGVAPFRNKGEQALIKLSEPTTGRLASKPTSEDYQSAKQTLIHELVHTNQPQSRHGSPLPHWLLEGGAELLSRKVSRAEGNTYLYDTHGPYQPYVRRVKQRGAAPYVRKTLRP